MNFDSDLTKTTDVRKALSDDENDQADATQFDPNPMDTRYSLA